MSSSRAQRVNQRGKVYRVTDRSPEKTILPILQEYKGQHIIIQIYRKGKPRRYGVIKTGEYKGERYALRQAYLVPDTHKGVNKEFRENFYWHWKTRSDDPSSYHLEQNDEIRVFAAVNLEGKIANQRFRQGDTHCFFKPIWNYAEERAALCSPKDRATKSRVRQLMNHLEHYEKTYADGIDEAGIESFLDDLKACYPLRIIIHNRFTTIRRSFEC